MKKKPLLATITIKFRGFTPDGKVKLGTSALYRDDKWYVSNGAQSILEELTAHVASAIGNAARNPLVDPKSIRFTFQIRDYAHNTDADKPEKRSRKKSS